MKAYPTVLAAPLTPVRVPVAALSVHGDFPGMNSADRAPREEILHRAYALWESEGHPSNRELANWLDAEADVLGRA